ncbi:hypothetical protein BXZ70DRAFT_964295 [Cristinia sonorae]|uniref:Uncharacterized protein n=1 Tax=Cristinia sonorae TaxID=1940300 RepID=A0A8K0XJY6_9AGAR|nr:hypothetical protein BXZ70DRAFT_964295 [Cristinia sonorae]
MAKRSFVSDQQTHQAFPVSTAHSLIITDAAAKVTQPSALSDEDDDDDICPVCESECTCHNKSNAAIPQIRPSHTPASTSSFEHSSVANVPQSLKIKLTLPAHLKVRKAGPSHSAGQDTAPNPHPRTSLYHTDPLHDFAPRLGQNVGNHPPPRRPGRPPTSAAHAHADSGTTQKDARKAARPPPSARAQPITKRRPKSSGSSNRAPARGGAFLQAPRRTLSNMPAEDSDSQDAVSDVFPTFMSAASISTRDTSSDSSASESSELTDLSSDEDEERGARTRRLKTKAKQDVFGDEGLRKRRDQAHNRWEIRTRMQSVGPDENDHEVDSGEATSEEDNGVAAEDDDADDDDAEDDDDDVEGEADVENEGLMEAADEDEEDAEHSGDGGLGVSFGGVGTGWSDDEESSFDADLFFANLDGSSDSDSAATPRLSGAQVSDDSDMDDAGSFSADEDDALFLMDVEPSTHVRRDRGEFEFGIALSGLSSAWDDPFGGSYVANTSDIDMDGSSESETEDGGAGQDDTGIVLEETDGETTEDELVDANGLPNSRAMMLFRWPTAVSTVSTVDPSSTMSPRADLTPPMDASPSVRIALASFSPHLGSPPPTPADILAGKISMYDYDEMEDSHVHFRSKRAVMGQFPAVGEPTRSFAVVDGSGNDTSTPFPRTRTRKIMRVGTSMAVIPSADMDDNSPIRQRVRHNLSDLQLVSSDDGGPRSQTQDSDDGSSAEPIDLDDLLEAAFLSGDSPPITLERLSDMPAKLPSFGHGMHNQSLNRWDRIPVSTFRHTQETAAMDTAGSDTTMNTPMARRTLLGDGKAREQPKTPLSHRKHPKNKFTVSPVLFPTPDGNAKSSSPSAGTSQTARAHRNKTKRESRKELFGLKKSYAKQTSRKSQPQRHHHHHHHYPNSKSRASSSMQRPNNFGSSGSSIPHLNL